MVFPLIAVALAGVGGGLLGGLLGGGSKKEIHAPKEHYAPVSTYSPAITEIYAPAPIYQIDSPYAVAETKTKIAAKTTAAPDVVSGRSEADVEGMDMTKIAIIGVIGLVAYGLVSKPSGGRR